MLLYSLVVPRQLLLACLGTVGIACMCQTLVEVVPDPWSPHSLTFNLDDSRNSQLAASETQL